MLKVLKECAAACSSFIRMADLDPGRYPIQKFSIRDSKYGKRLVIEVDEGYIYLPEKMIKKFKTEAAVNKLNKERYDLVFNGKDEHANRLDFTFEKHDSDEEDVEESDNESDDNVAGAYVVAPKKQKKH